MKNTRFLALSKATAVVLLAFAFDVMLASHAFATVTPMGTVLCLIIAMVYGNLGRALATLAVIMIGVGATLGKVSWGLAITVAVGIAVIFNASAIVNILTGAFPC